MTGVNQAPQGKAVQPTSRSAFRLHLSGIVGKDEIMVRSVDSLIPALVAKANNPSSLFWSPDSSRIYFVNNAGVWSVSRVGGEPEQVLKGYFAAAALSPDGKAMILWLTVGKPDTDEPKLWISSPPGAPSRAAPGSR